MKLCLLIVALLRGQGTTSYATLSCMKLTVTGHKTQNHQVNGLVYPRVWKFLLFTLKNVYPSGEGETCLVAQALYPPPPLAGYRV